MSAPPFRVLGICGSLRAISSNKTLLQLAVRVAPPEVRFELLDTIADLPHFNPDLDRSLDDPALPEPVRRLRALVDEADALVISSPEYAHGVPGSLKNALDWLVGGSEMPGKRVALWNTAPHATHAQAALAETLRTMSAELMPEAWLSVSLRGRADVESGGDAEIVGLVRGALVVLVEGVRPLGR